MATSTYPTMTGAIDNTSHANFIPAIWEDEVIAAYKSNLQMGALVRKMPFQGKKGDTIYLPKPTRGDANAKAEGTAVTIQNPTVNQLTISIDKHYEYSTLIEDITSVQAFNSMRQFYTDDAGYQLAKQVDDDLFTEAQAWGDGTVGDWVHSQSFYADTATSIAAYAVDTVVATDAFTDAVFRRLMQVLDDQDVPMTSRYFVIPPSLKNTILGIDQYVSTDYVNGKPTVNGKIGTLYGVEVYVSTNCPVTEAAADNAVSAVDTRGCMLFHKDATVFVEQLGVRSQTQYKQEFLADLFTADTIYGVKAYRPEAGVVFNVPDVVTG